MRSRVVISKLRFKASCIRSRVISASNVYIGILNENLLGQKEGILYVGSAFRLRAYFESPSQHHAIISNGGPSKGIDINCNHNPPLHSPHSRTHRNRKPRINLRGPSESFHFTAASHDHRKNRFTPRTNISFQQHPTIPRPTHPQPRPPTAPKINLGIRV